MISGERGHRDSDAALAELQELLLGPEGGEAARIERIEERLNTARLFAQEIARVLPEAVSLRAKRDRSLVQALRAPVEEALQESVRKNPQPLVDAIFPVIGPAIRKSIKSAIRGMVEQMEAALQHSFSPRSLRWRIQAWRTGKPFAEIVVLKTLRYRVEQVFLIHKDTGVLLQHVAAEAVAAKDASLVSSMLSAIQDFVKDSFDASEGDALESLRVGEFTIWIEQGSNTVSAAVFRGTAPEELRRVLRSGVRHVEAEMGQDLQAFDGDVERFALCRHYLESCLLQASAKKKKSDGARLILCLAGLALVLYLGYAGMHWFGDRRAWSHYLELLENEPGIVVTESGKRDGRFYVLGLRDPLAPEPRDLLESLDPERVEVGFRPYQSLEPAFVLRRARRLLQPPPGVAIELRGDRLVVTGDAPPEWLEEARRAANLMPGVGGLDVEKER